MFKKKEKKTQRKETLSFSTLGFGCAGNDVLGCGERSRKRGNTLTQGGKNILAGRPALGLPLEQNSGIYGQKQVSLRSMGKIDF